MRVLFPHLHTSVFLTIRWCGPCKLLAPRLEKVLSEHETPVKLVKVDVDNFQDLAMKYRVCISKGDMELVDDLCIASTKYIYIYIYYI